MFWQEQAIINLGDVSKKVQDKFLANVKRIAAEEKIPQNVAILAASGGLSASQTDIPGTLENLRTAARVSAATPENIEPLIKAMFTSEKVTASEKGAVNLGFMMGLMGQSRATTLETIAPHGRPAGAHVHPGGGTARESGSLGAAMSHAMDDEMMRRSGTASIALAEGLAKFLPEKDRLGFKKGKPFVERAATGLKTTRERIEFLRREENELLSREFMTQTSFEKKAKMSAMQMVGIEGFGDAAYQQYATALKAFPTMKEAAVMGARKLEAVRQPFEQQVAESERGHLTRIEQIQGSRTARLRAIERTYSHERMMETLEAGGMNWMNRQATSLGWWAIPGARQEQYGANVREQANVVRARGDTALADMLERHLKEQTAELKRMTRAMEARDRQPQPAGVGGNLNQHAE